MDIAHRIAAEGAPHGTVVVTGKQYAGRGQYARIWDAKRGEALLCSIIIRPGEVGAPAEQLQSTTLRAACAVHRMLRERLSVAARIRWPNDILIAGQKVCGILCEYRGGSGVDHDHGVHHDSDKGASLGAHIAIGIGINCCQRRFPHQYETEPTSLYLSGCGRRRGSIAPRALLEPLISVLCDELTKTQGWCRYMNAYLWRRGEAITVRPAISHQSPFAARLISVGENGSLHYMRISDSKNVNIDTHTTSPIEQLYAGSIR